MPFGFQKVTVKDADSNPENSEIFLHYLLLLCPLYGNNRREFHKIIEYTNLVVTHKDHCVGILDIQMNHALCTSSLAVINTYPPTFSKVWQANLLSGRGSLEMIASY